MADRKIIIAGNEFTIPQPFETGHVCSEGEARALNQLLAENVRNNMASKVKDGTADAAAILAYANEYQFSAASVAKPKLDPLEAEARKQAKTLIKAALKEQGVKFEDVDEGALEDEITRVSQLEDVVKLAKGIVAARSKASSINLASLNVGGGAQPAA